MAIESSVSSEVRRYNGRITSFLVLSCMVAASGGIIFGYDVGISAGLLSEKPFVKKFFPHVYNKVIEDPKISTYCRRDSPRLTAFTSTLYSAGLIASFLASPITRAYGCKPSILLGGVVILGGAALGGVAYNIRMLIIGRVLLGVGVGLANQSVPLYLSEMAPSRYRGAFNVGFQFCFALGILSANLMNYGTQKIDGGWGWRISLAMAAVPASILTLGAIFLPQTPNRLIQQNKDIAKQMLQKIRGTEDIQPEFDDLVRANEILKTVKHPFRNIIRKKYRPQLVMAIVIPFFQVLTGINVIGSYAPIIFKTIGFGESAALRSAVVTGIVALSMTLLSLLIVDKLGRRTILIIGGIQMFISQVLVGSIMAINLGDQGELSKGCGLFVLILVCCYVAGYGLSWGPLGVLIPSEIFPLEIRSAGQSITVAMAFLFTFVITQTFLAMLCHFKSGTFFFFSGWVVVMTIFVYLFLPETKGVPIERMDRIWKQHCRAQDQRQRSVKALYKDV
ncbi:hexose carrier protein HEX6 [Artemisia annua]|uniref:Hexose carrier protein HEX6 n=1 Tax=Artemisia annua TaxID=35608 RepID=A0A2U1PCB2_ARTAN|nr:hexose carrier protein HEX6 [Artemisia annua]